MMQKTSVRFLISFFLIGLLVFLFRDKLDEVWAILRRTSLSHFLLVFAAWVGFQVLTAFRLKLILQGQQIVVSLTDAFVIVMSGYFFNNFIPSIVGGDIAKCVYVSRLTGKVKEVASAVFLDRLVGVFTLLSIGFISLLFFPDVLKDPAVKFSFFLVMTMLVGVLLFFFNRSIRNRFRSVEKIIPFEKIRHFLKQFYEAIHGYRENLSPLLLACGVSFIIHFGIIYSVYYLTKAISITIPASIFYVFFPVISFSALVPTINGLGAREAMFVFFFAPFTHAENAIAISILLDFIIVMLGILGGLCLAFKGKMSLQELRSLEVEGGVDCR